MFRSVLAAATLCLAALPVAPLGAQTAAPPLPRANFITAMDGEFNKYDSNKDGALTKLEIEAGHRATATAQARVRAQALFQRLDLDRNGSLSAAEFGKLPLDLPPVDATGLMKFDINRDSRVSLIEHRTATLANFDRLDVDKDGTVNAVEMKAMQARR